MMEGHYQPTASRSVAAFAMLEVGRGNGLGVRCLEQLVPCLSHARKLVFNRDRLRLVTFRRIQLALDIIQHVTNVDLS